jgi:hypothetical protein
LKIKMEENYPNTRLLPKGMELFFY